MASLYWARTDLRVHDNAALHAAAQQGPVTAVYLAAPGQWRIHGDAPAKIDFWLRNLRAFADALAQRGIDLHVLTMDTWAEAPDLLADFCDAHGIGAVHCNIEYPVNERRRDGLVARRLRERGVALLGHHGAVLLAPGTVRTGGGDYYRVFTPFSKRCRDLLREAPQVALPPPAAQSVPRRGEPPAPTPLSADGFQTPPAAFGDQWPAGEDAAHAALDAFVDEAITAYDTRRDLPAYRGTSRVSAYLAAGVLSPGQCLRAALSANQGELDSGSTGVRTWITEILWREFYQHLLAGFPSLSMHQPMKPETAAVPWRDAPDDLQAWQQGRTGVPIVDAGMRELLACGWMHNRVRMVTAMFLSKNLLIDWRLGEAWFMAHLVDGDLAANNGGWQWSASTGADAAPYFRVFNPVSQSQRFDPQGVYLRRWLPELANLDNKAIHEPSAAQRKACGYPAAIVDLKTSRQRAIDAYAGLK